MSDIHVGSLHPLSETRSFKETYHFEATWDVTAENPRLQCLHMATNISLRVQHMTILGELVEFLLLLVGEDYVGVMGLDHQQCLTQRSRTLP